MLTIRRAENQQGRASIRKFFVGILLILIFLSTSGATPPHIWTSVDDYKSVCAEEQVYLTCLANDSWSLSWSSLDYIGHKAAIEFNQAFDRPGVGKLVSLPNGRATLSQMIKTEQSLSSDLKITVPGHLSETLVTCTNYDGEAITKSFILAREPPAPITLQQTKKIATNLTTGVNIYRLRWRLPANIDNIDLKHIRFQIDQQSSIILMNNSTELILPFTSHAQHRVSIVAVDWCDRQSQPTIFPLDVSQNGPSDPVFDKYRDKSFQSNTSSAKDVNTFNDVIVLMVLSVFLLFSISL